MIRLARTVDELKAAYRLLHDEYVRFGYQDPDPIGIRFLPQYALPNTHTFVIVENEEVVGTATLIFRGRLGMPLEVEYPNELNALCAAGRRPAEISGLAVGAKNRTATLRLFGTMYAFAHYALGVTDLCITVNPAHAGFYEKFFLFKKIGGVRPCEKVKGAPAVLLRLDLTTIEQHFASPAVAGGMGGVLSPSSAKADGMDYRRLAQEVNNDLLEAISARLEIVHELMTRGSNESSPAHKWEPWQKKVITRKYEKATRRFGIKVGGAS